MSRVEYDSTNSGGDWWLTDEDWFALERAGWVVKWKKNEPPLVLDGKTFPSMTDAEGRYLGALATEAELSRDGLTLGDAISEWERITGKNSADLGCSCCGAPHNFRFIGDDGESEYFPVIPPDSRHAEGH